MRSMQWEDVEIEFVDSCKNLGVILDSQLTLSNHVKDVVRVVNFYLFEFRYIRSKINQSTANKLSNFILTKLDYCNVLYINLLPPLDQSTQSPPSRTEQLCQVPHKYTTQGEDNTGTY